MNYAINLRPTQAATQEQRTADILAFAKTLPPGPRPYVEHEFSRLRELGQIVEIIEISDRLKANDPPGSLGAARVPPEVVWSNDRVVIEIRIGETERAVDEVQDALIDSDRGLYRRGGLIVSTGFDKMQTWDGRSIEVQIIEERNNYALLEDIEAVASFERYNPKTEQRTKVSPPMTLANTLKQRTTRLRLPNLVSVINCPTIKANGELITDPGFYPDIGILFHPRGVKFPITPPQPGKAAALTAMARIMRLIETFDFVSKDDKAVALSLILTAIARPCLPTAPLHGFDAPVAGSGKSKLVDIASILATGHEAGVSAQGETREEAEKRFSTLLMRGDLIIAIDNCETPLEGVVFNQALTQSWANLRILGQSKAIRVRCAAMITATGNNLIIKGDLTRRSVVCRLDPRVERPELRQFTYDPIADAKDHRAELVAAVITILRAYHVAGRPNRPPRLQSFELWSDTVRGALAWLGAGDPAGTMDRLRKADPVLASLTAVLVTWRNLLGSEPTTASEAITAATVVQSWGADNPDEDQRAGLRDALMAVAARGGKLDSRALGFWLKHHAADRVVNIAGKPVAMEALASVRGSSCGV